MRLHIWTTLGLTAALAGWSALQAAPPKSTAETKPAAEAKPAADAKSVAETKREQRQAEAKAKKEAAAKAAAAKNAAPNPKPARPAKVVPPWITPELPGGKSVVTDKSDDFLKAPEGILPDVKVAQAAPTVDFLFCPGQTFRGSIWSNWGDGSVAGGKYYSAIGDHDAPAGTAHVYEYDPATKTIRTLVDLKSLLKRPEGEYSPSKIHSRVDMGSDGMLYYATHRGSERVTADAYGYKGDWILKTDPATGKTEVLAHGAVEKHCIPTSVLDPERMIFYGGTAQGKDAPAQTIQFLAYDVKNKKVLYQGDNGPRRCLIFAKSTGRVYWVPEVNDEGPLVRWDPAVGGTPVPIEAVVGLRAATQETPQGIVYTASSGQGGKPLMLYAFNVKTEKSEVLGPLEVGKNKYVATMDVDPTGRYIYYIPGAHGGSEIDGSAVVQYDVQTKTKKVVAFLHPFYKDKYGATLKGTYSTALSADGGTLFVTWNVDRVGAKAWDCCAITAIHIPESERQP